MRAALIEASNTPLQVVDDLDIEEPRTGEVRVRVSHCGLCHSDLSLANGQFPVMTPTVLGHEAAGVVDAAGDGVARHARRQGRAVPIPACDQCYWCVGAVRLLRQRSSLLTGTSDGRTPLSREAGTPSGVGLGGLPRS
jgi:Zn-dependent alcohol dehydrogenase